VIKRAEILDRCPLDASEIEELLAALVSVTEWVPIYYSWRPNLKDEGDNHVIELAIAGNAQVVVTNNIRDFQGAELLFPKLSILKPEQMIRN
jgi:predicted nucleic acid-binding protein